MAGEKAEFTKNDSGFRCAYCGKEVEPLVYSSRDHCPECLASLHVDINPGDRANECRGLFLPIGIKTDAKKGYIIEYRCKNCGKLHNNRAASDDNFETVLKVMNGTFQYRRPKR